MQNMRLDPGQWKTIFKLRGWLIVPPMVFIVLCPWWEVENRALAFGLGGAVFALGLFLRIWAQMNLHYRLKIQKVLTATGPYAFVRNPIYIGNTTMFVGATIVSKLLWFVPIMIMYCAIVYYFVVRYEEHHLRQRYGQPYIEYLNRIPRWFPRLKRAPGAWPAESNRFLLASLLVELHNVLLLVPVCVKDLIHAIRV